MNQYDLRMATQAEILLRNTEDSIAVLKEVQTYISDMNPSLAFKLWQKVELDLAVFRTTALQTKEEYGTPDKKD